MEKILNPQHLDDLYSSGLTDETIRELGFYSGTAAEVHAILGFAAGSGLIIPYSDTGGGEPFGRVKPDQPPIINGHSAKYLSPKNSIGRAYIPLRTSEVLEHPMTGFLITEGEKKAAKATQEGFPCIGLSGIWGFSQNHQLIPDLMNISWEGREVFLAPDSDYSSNPNVKLAVSTLERWLTRLGASVLVVRIPTFGDNPKVGLDDFLIASGPDALRQLVEAAKPSLFWEIEDITALPEHKRLKPTQRLLEKLADMEPIEISLWKKSCHEKLGISASDFKAQLKVARQEKQRKQTLVKELDVAKTAEGNRCGAEREAAELSRQAIDMLEDPALLYRIGETVHQLGMAGEDENIHLVYLAITSRILNAPISITLRGESSSGKSYLVGKVCQLFPPSAYIALTGMSRQALVYTDESYAHKTMIFFERPGMDAADYNIRTLQSEGRVIFWVPEKDPVTNKWVTCKVEKEGPTNFIFTTTVPELHPENETRHWSLSMDESPRLTSAAKLETAKIYESKAESLIDNILVWQYLQNELRPLNVCILYAGWLSEHTPNKPIRMRRDFSKLLALIEIIAILHQHQRYVRKDGILVASLSDYFMARELVDKVFQASLFGINEKVKGLVNGVRSLYEKKLDRGDQEPSVKPLELAPDLGCSSSSVSRWLRPAIEAGLVEIVSETAKGRIKSVKPGLAGKDVASVLPSIEDLAEAFPELASGFKAVHPVTGKELTLKDTAVVATAENNILAGL